MPYQNQTRERKRAYRSGQSRATTQDERPVNNPRLFKDPPKAKIGKPPDKGTSLHRKIDFVSNQEVGGSKPEIACHSSKTVESRDTGVEVTTMAVDHH
ncbi:unnamed protein product [Linum trigynum]|uniref:Uncharacterized protein n=1 Tax=Linum trigynum TaxID=586398 RepID=A0AAV2GJM5_9ROSI